MLRSRNAATSEHCRATLRAHLRIIDTNSITLRKPCDFYTAVFWRLVLNLQRANAHCEAVFGEMAYAIQRARYDVKAARWDQQGRAITAKHVRKLFSPNRILHREDTRGTQGVDVFLAAFFNSLGWAFDVSDHFPPVIRNLTVMRTLDYIVKASKERNVFERRYLREGFDASAHAESHSEQPAIRVRSRSKSAPTIAGPSLQHYSALVCSRRA